MQDLISELLKHLRSAWRFRWWALGVASVVCVAGWTAVTLQSDVYEARARVYVDVSSDLRTLLEDQIVEASLEDQLRYVRQAMLGAVQLEQVARETGLADGTEDEHEMQELIALLRSDIQITSANDALPVGARLMRGPTDDTYTIVYQNSQRATAVQVVKALLHAFEERVIGGKMANSEQSGEFLRKQIQVYEERLRNAEDRLARFNRENYDRLPDLQGGYFTQLQTQKEELETSRKDLRLAQSRLERVQQQLTGEARLTETAEVDPQSLEGRIRSHQNRLDELRLSYTESHPDVMAVRESLEQLKAEQTRQQALLESGDLSLTSNNPVYQALQISKNEIEAEIATLQADIDVREARLTELHGLINEMPEVEAELAQLNRDYEVVRERYQTLLDSLERERLSREVVQSEDLEFRVIDPPAADARPVSPRRALQILMVMAAALGIGGGLAFALSQLKPVFWYGNDLVAAVRVPVIGVVSRVLTRDERRHRVISVARFMAAAMVLAIGFLAVLGVEVAGPGLRSLL